SSIARRSSTSGAKWQITCCAKRPLLPITVPREPSAAPETTIASLPTHANVFSAWFAPSALSLTLTPGCTMSASQPNAVWPRGTLWTMPPGVGGSCGCPSAPIRYGEAGSVGYTGDETCPCTDTPTSWCLLSRNTGGPSLLVLRGERVGADHRAR